MTPWGDKILVLGNNPIGVVIPHPEGPYFILDIAVSIAARGKVREAAEKKK